MNILKFSATWCGPCKNLAKQLEDTDLPIINYDVDDESSEEAVSKYGVRNVPVLVFVDDSGTELKRLVGAINKQKVIDTYKELQAD